MYEEIEETEMLDLIAIQTDAGVMIAECEDFNKSYIDNTRLIRYLFDSKKPEPTFHKSWVKIDAMPARCQRVIPECSRVTGYTLKPEFTVTSATPMAVGREFFADEDGVNYGYRGLYDEVREDIPEQYEDTEFTITVLAEVENFDVLKGFSFPYKERDGRKFNITEREAVHQLLDQLIFPEPLIAVRPCKLSREASYKIIRQHIRENIDGHYAEMTDYDFCLRVEKIIKLSEAEPFEVNQGTEKRPKIVTKYRARRAVRVYEIAPAKYQDYPLCEPFEGADYRELEENIRKYLDNLMAEINKPLADCPHCKGLGVVTEATP